MGRNLLLPRRLHPRLHRPGERLPRRHEQVDRAGGRGGRRELRFGPDPRPVQESAQKLNFTLFSDEDGAVAKQFGVPVKSGAQIKAKDADGKAIEFKRNLTATRWTFVVGKDGKIAYKNTKVTPADDAKKITEFVTKAEGK